MIDGVAVTLDLPEEYLWLLLDRYSGPFRLSPLRGRHRQLLPEVKRYSETIARGSDSSGAKNNELGLDPQFHGVFPSRNPSPQGRYEKSHSRVIIENQEPVETCRLPSFARKPPERLSAGSSLLFSPLLSEA